MPMPAASSSTGGREGREPAQAATGVVNAGTQVAGNTISFSLQHNAYTGQLVIYDTRNNGAPIATGLGTTRSSTFAEQSTPGTPPPACSSPTSWPTGCS